MKMGEKLSEAGGGDVCIYLLGTGPYDSRFMGHLKKKNYFYFLLMVKEAYECASLISKLTQLLKNLIGRRFFI